MEQTEDSDPDELVNITTAANQSGMVSASQAPSVSVNATSPSGFETHLMVPLYIVIFVLAILGNTMVLLTLGSNKRMRTVTNVYLLNLVSRFQSINSFSLIIHTVSIAYNVK